MRKKLSMITHGFLPLILLTGFFVAGISGGMSCNTYPFVGESLFYNKNHFHAEHSFWQNMFENKLIA